MVKKNYFYLLFIFIVAQAQVVFAAQAPEKPENHEAHAFKPIAQLAPLSPESHQAATASRKSPKQVGEKNQFNSISAILRNEEKMPAPSPFSDDEDDDLLPLARALNFDDVNDGFPLPSPVSPSINRSPSLGQFRPRTPHSSSSASPQRSRDGIDGNWRSRASSPLSPIGFPSSLSRRLNSPASSASPQRPQEGIEGNWRGRVNSPVSPVGFPSSFSRRLNSPASPLPLARYTPQNVRSATPVGNRHVSQTPHPQAHRSFVVDARSQTPRPSVKSPLQQLSRSKSRRIAIMAVLSQRDIPEHCKDCGYYALHNGFLSTSCDELKPEHYLERDEFSHDGKTFNFTRSLAEWRDLVRQLDVHYGKGVSRKKDYLYTYLFASEVKHIIVESIQFKNSRDKTIVVVYRKYEEENLFKKMTLDRRIDERAKKDELAEEEKQVMQKIHAFHEDKKPLAVIFLYEGHYTCLKFSWDKNDHVVMNIMDSDAGEKPSVNFYNIPAYWQLYDLIAEPIVLALSQA